MVNIKKAIEMLWKDTCTISVKKEVTDPVNKRTSFEDDPIYIDQPCKISYETVTTTNEANVATQSLRTKLFISQELDIPPGSKISVTSKGRTTEYKQSGVPAVYTNHQEIILELFEERA